MILLEPPLISAALDAKYGHFNAMLATKALKRRQVWSSRQEAMLWFSKQQRTWDPQCRELFAVSIGCGREWGGWLIGDPQEYGLRRTSEGISLNGTGAQEAACYSVAEQDEVLKILGHICPRLPVYTIFSEFVDLSP